MITIAGKSLSEMTEQEMREWIEMIRGQREALRAEAVEKKARGEATPKAPRKQRAAKPVDSDVAEILKGFLS